MCIYLKHLEGYLRCNQASSSTWICRTYDGQI